MQKRPLSLTIIAAFLVLSAVIGLFSVMTMGSNAVAMQMIEQMGLSLQVQQALGILGCIIALACAYGIFKGLPWSRVLYVAWGLVSVAIGLATSPAMSFVLLTLVFVAVISFFLFRPAADRWFAARGLQLKRGDAG